MKHESQPAARARRILIVMAAAGALVPTAANAFNFKPTPAEWALWPDFCKARYVQTSIGRKSPYYGTVPAAAQEAAQRRLGTQAFTHVHHYCASLVYSQRAGVARSGQDRKYQLRLAEGNCNYSLQRTPPTSPVYREIASQCQMAATARATAL